MKLREILAGIETIMITANLETEISGVSYDSRKTIPGDIFVAVKGFESDGHQFIKSAVENGAGAVICENAPGDDMPYVQVKNSRLALAIASKNFFGDPASEMRLIGITGTNGKTTSSMLIKHMLEGCEGAKVGLVGTNQNMIGRRKIQTERTTPESRDLQELLREMADEGCNYVVMEVSSHSLVLERVAGLRFEVGIFTNLTQDHLDFHEDMDEYAKAKALLFERCEKAAVNIDDEYADYIINSAKCPVLTYSTKKNEADLVAKDIRLSPTGVKFCALTPGVLERVALPVPGVFSVYNCLSAIACGLLLGYSVSQTAIALRSAQGVRGRMEVVPSDGDYTIIIDYAHTPNALENALYSLSQVTEGRVVVVFGCGGDRDRSKRPKMGAAAAANADYIIVTSDNPRTEAPEAIIDDIVEGLKDSDVSYEVITDRRQAIAFAIDNHKPKDIILLAGKGHEDYQIIGTTKHHMDEREIVAEHLGRRSEN